LGILAEIRFQLIESINLKQTCMKTKTAFLVLSLICISMVSHSQTKEKSSDPSLKRSSIGIQYNPESNRNNKFLANSYSIRYGYKIAHPITIGAEISGFFPNGNMPDFTNDPNDLNDRWYDISTKLFVRYSFRADKQLQFFIEASPYAELFMGKPMHIRGGNIYVYAAPGVSLFSKNKRFSIDLYYKLSTEYNIRGNHGEFAYKLNFHF
jgi:hypothetical protein